MVAAFVQVSATREESVANAVQSLVAVRGCFLLNQVAAHASEIIQHAFQSGLRTICLFPAMPPLYPGIEFLFLPSSTSTPLLPIVGCALKHWIELRCSAWLPTCWDQKDLLLGSDSSFLPRGWQRAVFDQQSSALLEIGISAEVAQAIFGGHIASFGRPSSSALARSYPGMLTRS